MKNLINHWKEGLSYLFSDDLISFYTFFTIIFAECVYLRIFYSNSIVIQFTIILLGYVVNIIVCAWFKGYWEVTKVEVVFTIIYSIVFITLFIIGCFINIKISIIMTIIPLIITAISIVLREGNYTVLANFIIVGGPFIAFTISILMFPTLPIILKIIIPIVYALCVPFIPYIEDETAALNIFELATNITWNKDLEDFRKKISKY